MRIHNNVSRLDVLNDTAITSSALISQYKTAEYLFKPRNSDVNTHAQW